MGDALAPTRGSTTHSSSSFVACDATKPESYDSLVSPPLQTLLLCGIYIQAHVANDWHLWLQWMLHVSVILLMVVESWDRVR